MIAFSFDISIFARLGSKICAIGIILVLEDTASSTSTISLSTSTITAKTAQLQKPTARKLLFPTHGVFSIATNRTILDVSSINVKSIQGEKVYCHGCLQLEHAYAREHDEIRCLARIYLVNANGGNSLVDDVISVFRPEAPFLAYLPLRRSGPGSPSPWSFCAAVG